MSNEVLYMSKKDFLSVISADWSGLKENVPLKGDLYLNKGVR